MDKAVKTVTKVTESSKEATVFKLDTTKRCSSTDVRKHFNAMQKVAIRIPKTETESEDVSISINGYVCVIQRGVWADVPEGILGVLEDAVRTTLTQEMAADNSSMVNTYSEGIRIPFEIKRLK